MKTYFFPKFCKYMEKEKLFQPDMKLGQHRFLAKKSNFLKTEKPIAHFSMSHLLAYNKLAMRSLKSSTGEDW